MRRSVALLWIMAVVFIIAYVTKPSNEKCIAEANSQYRGNVIGKVDATLPSTINRQIFTATLEKAFLQSLTVQDKIFYKEIVQQKGNVKTVIGWGALGMVNVDVK